MLRRIFTSPAGASIAVLMDMADEITANLQTGKLNNKLRLAHFFAQVREEVGLNVRLHENLNYSSKALKQLFQFYIVHPDQAELHGRNSDHRADQEAIANNAYANRIGNRDAASGDGWKYRGRGMKQLTGRSNYQRFTTNHALIWQGNEDFLLEPDRVAELKYAVRSAIEFWLRHKLYETADAGHDRAVTDSITKVVNKHTKSYAARHKHLQAIVSNNVFKAIFD